MSLTFPDQTGMENIITFIVAKAATPRQRSREFDCSSAVASAAYTIAPVLPTPTFSPVAGTYTSAQSVTISDSTAGTTIYYTTNGTTPTTSSAVYSGPIAVTSTQLIEAIGVVPGYVTSQVTGAKYTIE